MKNKSPSPLVELSADFLKNRHQLIAYIYGLTGDPHNAEDILQEVWIRLAAQVEEGREVNKPAHWCRGVARNLVLHHWRSQKNDKVQSSSALLDLFDQAFDEADKNDDTWSDRREALMNCMEELPENSREILRLKYDCGFKVSAVASQLKKSVASMMMSLSRIRRGLADCIDKRLEMSS